MAQNVTLWGASYSNVPAINVPKTGGGTATFYDPTGSKTVTNNGTYDVTELAQMVVNISGGGGGGASNIVTGTFTGTESGAMDIDLPYSGSGFPITVIIYPSEGAYNNVSGSFYNLKQRYAAVYFSAIKTNMTVPPTYHASGGSTDYASVHLRYKSSASSATSYTSSTSNSTATYYDADASSGSSSLVRLRSATKLSVFIASTSYGFAFGIEYTYHVIYSA